MVDISAKSPTLREATALAKVVTSRAVAMRIRSKSIQKGDVLSVARIAGILAAKKTHELIPLCHPLRLDCINLAFKIVGDGVWIRSHVKLEGKTGVEMEALTAASVAALTIYDMCKSVQKDMTNGPVCLMPKSGGKSGTYLNANREMRVLADGRASWL